MDSSIRICVSSFFNSALKNNFRQQRTKSHISAFLKCDGNIEVHVSATFMFCGNVLYQVLAIPSSFCHISGSESHASVILSQDVSAVVRSRYVSANGFLISLLNLCNENKLIMVLCVVFIILTKLKIIIEHKSSFKLPML